MTEAQPPPACTDHALVCHARITQKPTLDDVVAKTIGYRSQAFAEAIDAIDRAIAAADAQAVVAPQPAGDAGADTEAAAAVRRTEAAALRVRLQLVQQMVIDALNQLDPKKYPSSILRTDACFAPAPPAGAQAAPSLVERASKSRRAPTPGAAPALPPAGSPEIDCTTRLAGFARAANALVPGAQCWSTLEGILHTSVGFGVLSGLFGVTYLHTFDPFISGRGQGNGIGIAADAVAVERLLDKK